MATQLNTTNPSVPSSAARSGMLAGKLLRSKALADARSRFMQIANSCTRNCRSWTPSYRDCLIFEVRNARRIAKFDADMQAREAAEALEAERLGPERMRLLTEINSLEMANYHTVTNRTALAACKAQLASLAA